MSNRDEIIQKVRSTGFLPEQQRSKTFKFGEPTDHLAAKQKAYFFLEDNKKQENWYIHPEYKYYYTEDFIAKQKLKDGFRDTFWHKFDIVVLEDNEYSKPIAFIEIMGNEGYTFAYPFGADRKIRKKKAYPTKHSKTNQKINDGINTDFVNDCYPQAKQITLLKERINCDAKYTKDEQERIKERELYMRRELRELIK